MFEENDCKSIKFRALPTHLHKDVTGQYNNDMEVICINNASTQCCNWLCYTGSLVAQRDTHEEHGRLMAPPSICRGNRRRSHVSARLLCTTRRRWPKINVLQGSCLKFCVAYINGHITAMDRHPAGWLFTWIYHVI